jgi:hypothetical protein
MALLRMRIWEATERLPAVCMTCAQPANQLRDKRFSYNPPWIWIFLLVGGLLPLLIVYLVTVKRARVIAPLCDQHAGQWKRTNTVAALGFLGVLGLIVLAIAANSGQGPSQMEWLWFLVLAGFLGWLIALVVVSRNNIRPYVITKEEIVLDRVHPDFVEAVIQMDAEREGDLGSDRDRPQERPPLRLPAANDPGDDRIQSDRRGIH